MDYKSSVAVARMPLRTPTSPDFFEKFLINRTEDTVNTAFLWVFVLKQLNKHPLTPTQLRKEIARKHYNPHRTTLYTSITLLKSMKLIEQTSNNPQKKLQITPKGKLILERATKHINLNLAIILSGE